MTLQSDLKKRQDFNDVYLSSIVALLQGQSNFSKDQHQRYSSEKRLLLLSRKKIEEKDSQAEERPSWVLLGRTLHLSSYRVRLLRCSLPRCSLPYALETHFKKQNSFLFARFIV